MALLNLLSTTPYALAYALPLLLLSFPVTFAGAFLTLDRTRIFASRNDSGYVGHTPGLFELKPRRSGFRIPLQGGLGGLLGGYLVGLHAATFLALLIPGVSTTASLSPKSFVPVWLLSAISTTVLGGRWRYAALAMYGIAGGAMLALSLSVIAHPSLLTRIVLVSIFASLFVLFAALPIKRTQHIALRIAAASTGAFGMVLAIAILVRVPAWANAWERLWVKDGAEWGTSKEKGLSAAFCLFLTLGATCDWFLRRRFGENPDQQWDSYLADYAANLPNTSDRAGVFRPLASPLSKLFHKGYPAAPTSADAETTLFAEDIKGTPPPPPYPVKLQNYDSRSNKSPLSPDLDTEPFDFSINSHKRPGFLKKKSTSPSIPRVHGKRTREAVKFRPLAGDEAFSSSDEDTNDDERGESAGVRPWLRSQTSFAESSSSGVTLSCDAPSSSGKNGEVIDVEQEKAAIKQRRKGDAAALDSPDYSDVEDDAALATLTRRESRHSPGWSPEFLKQHKARATSGGLTTPGGSEQGSGMMTVPTTPLRSVPATPSLIRAIERVNQAQEAAYGFSAMLATSERVPQAEVRAEDEHQKSERWMSFWRDVKQKAAHG